MSDTPNVFADEWDDPFPPTEGWRSHIKRVVPPGQGLGMSVWELEGGQTQVPYHFHHGADELILVAAIHEHAARVRVFAKRIVGLARTR